MNLQALHRVSRICEVANGGLAGSRYLIGLSSWVRNTVEESDKANTYEKINAMADLLISFQGYGCGRAGMIEYLLR